MKCRYEENRTPMGWVIFILCAMLLIILFMLSDMKKENGILKAEKEDLEYQLRIIHIEFSFYRQSHPDKPDLKKLWEDK